MCLSPSRERRPSCRSVLAQHPTVEMPSCTGGAKATATVSTAKHDQGYAHVICPTAINPNSCQSFRDYYTLSRPWRFSNRTSQRQHHNQHLVFPQTKRRRVWLCSAAVSFECFLFFLVRLANNILEIFPTLCVSMYFLCVLCRRRRLSTLRRRSYARVLCIPIIRKTYPASHGYKWTHLRPSIIT